MLNTGVNSCFKVISGLTDRTVPSIYKKIKMDEAGSSNIRINDPNFQNIISDILSENCSEVSDDVTDNMCIDSNHNSESEQNLSESDESETESNTDNDDDIRPSKFLYDEVELRSLFGLLFYSAVFKSNHENANTLFATDGTGREIVRLVMSKKRFLFLISCLRFDNSDTRTERKENDPLAPISEIFNEFIENCKLNYSLSSCVTVDEMLVSFRGRCKFKMYIPNKPAKYGLKMMCLTDSRSHYLFNAYIYAGQNTDGITLDHTERKFSKPTQSVLRLSKPIQGTNPFLPKKKSTVGLTQYGFTKDLTLLSYVPKPNKAVLLISSMHNQKGFDNDVQKPEIISYYNSTKGGVDALDEKCSVYSTGRRTRRWPLAIFYRLLDISSVNSYVLYNSFKNNETMTRADYLKSLAFELVSPELERRFKNTCISREIRSGIGRVLGKSKNLKDTPVYEDKLESRKTCRICPPKKKRNTIYQCKLCGDPICLECSRKICSNCFGN
ncbi:uncharacterized protein LOC107883176 [Acyrthosiphon pisum]|uniref:PiggyBac transposable element-derived protein domain-containing protein n=1 Tax=Acyrthosiphon pisum TaxID=7029 RepID=A0A8R2H727_ACYPI|nr:uncharacterized protein LOC107883176 [Acyrthosiphon pisum]|eukprot:XP_016658230.1 PREDICTED: uncharacterized protein LOC107883176 [Acyrthosiphon pisum]